MARVALELTTADGASGDAFYPEARFMVAVNGTISGNLFVEIADRNDDMTADASWDNAHEESFDAMVKQKIFAGSPGYAYRVTAAAGPIKVTWDYVYTSTVPRGILD